MKKTLALMIALALGASCVLADGIWVDPETGRPGRAHTVVDLNPSQIEEMETLGTVTLTAGQWQSLRKKCRTIPKRFDTVLPITYRGCTCDMYNYCIALDRRQIAVHCFDEALLSTYTLKWILLDATIHMDRSGQCHVKGAPVPFQSLLEAISGEPDEFWVSDFRQKKRRITIAPAPLDNRNSPALRSRIEMIREAARKGGWEFEIEDDYYETVEAGRARTWLDDALKRD